MRNWKNTVNSVIGISGYKIVRRGSLEQDIALGKYRWLQDKEIATVLDIGANTGQFAEMIRKIFPEAMIYSFEPLKSSFQELAAKSLSLKPMKAFPFALGAAKSVVTIHHNDFSPSSSLLPMGHRHLDAYPFTRRSVDERVDVRSLDQMAAELSMKPPILAKLDVQGYELSVLEGAKRTIPLIDVLIIETSFVELYMGQPLFDDIYQFLRKRHFLYAGSLEQLSDPTNGATLQQDSVFFNQKKK